MAFELWGEVPEGGAPAPGLHQPSMNSNTATLASTRVMPLFARNSRTIDGGAPATPRSNPATIIRQALDRIGPRRPPPDRPPQTDDRGTVRNWKESRSQRLEHGQRLPVSDNLSRPRRRARSRRGRARRRYRYTPIRVTANRWLLSWPAQRFGAPDLASTVARGSSCETRSSAIDGRMASVSSL
jgi:hypothetical protein